MSDEVKERISPVDFVVGQPIIITERPVLQNIPPLKNDDHWWEDQEAMNAVREKLKFHTRIESNHLMTVALPSEEVIPTPENMRTSIEKHFITVSCITDHLNLHNEPRIEPVRTYYTEYIHSQANHETNGVTENAVVFAHGWVCGQKDIVDDSGHVQHLNYHDKVMAHLDSSIRIYAAEPPGYASDQADELESIGADQLDALDMHNYPQTIQTAVADIAEDMFRRGKKGKIVVVGHSMGGWASSMITAEFVSRMKTAYDVDVVVELTAPAFQMHKITSVGKLTPAINPLLHRIRNTLEHLPVRRVTQKTSEKITKRIIQHLGPLLLLKPDDIFMQQARRTDIRTTIRNLQDLWGNHYSEAEVRQITGQDFIRRIWLARKDTLVDNKNLVNNPKAIEVENEGHLLERNNAFAHLLARHLERDIFQAA
jgi:pimeloyl-ACP methyl ester carboxylesterase